MPKGLAIRIGLVILTIAAIGILLTESTYTGANPIPVPTIIMPMEYISATITSVAGEVYVKVSGTYPFQNIGYKEVTMYYPVPPDAAKIEVKMDDMPLAWSYSGRMYPTAIGDFPMITWTITPPDRFTIHVYYEHKVLKQGGRYTFLYAMGTGKYLQYYAKETIAIVRVRMEIPFEELQVLTDNTPADYILAQEDGTKVIVLFKKSEMFQPLKEDLILSFAAKLN